MGIHAATLDLAERLGLDESQDVTSTQGWGVALIVVGIVCLVALFTGDDVARYGWPLVIVAVGAILLFTGVAGVDSSAAWSRGRSSRPSASSCCTRTQRGTGELAYTWAAHTLRGRPRDIAAGRAHRPSAPRTPRGSVTFFFLILFAVGFTFFDGVLRISGRDFGVIAQYAFALLLIAASGVWS